MKENNEYEITKSSREDWIGVTFQCHIINKGVNVAPKWFRDWTEAFKKENDARWVRQEEFNKHVSDFIQQQLEFNNRVNNFMEQQVAFNSQQTEFNKYVLNVFKRNNLR